MSKVTLFCFLITQAGGWRLVGLPGQRILAVAAESRDNCYAATDSSLYRGDRFGWYLPVFRYGPHAALRVQVKNSSGLTGLAWGWGSRSDGLWLSTNQGQDWQVGTYFLYAGVLDVWQEQRMRRGLIVVGSDTMNNPPVRSTDGGTTWFSAHTGLPDNRVRCFAINSRNCRFVVCGTRKHGLYLSADSAASWRFLGPDSAADIIAADWWEGSILTVAAVNDTTAVWRTDDTGRSWLRELLLPFGTGVAFNKVCQLGGEGVYRGPGQWEPDTWGLSCRAVRCISQAALGAFWYIGTDSGVYHQDETPGVIEERTIFFPESFPPCLTVVRGSLHLPLSASRFLLTAAGRRVMELVPGANDVSHLAPGVYFVLGCTPYSTRAFESSERYRIVVMR